MSTLKTNSNIDKKQNPRIKDKEAEKIANREISLKYQKIKKPAYIKLRSLLNATNRKDLYLIPGNHTEKLKGKKDYYSIRINDQYRIIFKWDKKGTNQAEEITINPHNKRYGK